jgi:hypothetical protein
LCCKEFEYFPVLSRFRGEKSLLGRIRGERHSSITQTTAQKTPTVNWKWKGGICMIEKFQDYAEIKKAYPKTMSKDQFYRVAHISNVFVK